MRRSFAAGTLFATAHGTPPWRVLALPGWMHQAGDFDAALAPLGAGGLAVDLPGFGGSTPPPPAVWGAADYAAWLEALLDEDAMDERLVVVGHSFGGRVAVNLAARRPDRVKALVLAGVPLLRRRDRPKAKPAAAFRAARWLHRRRLLPDERMESMRQRYGSDDYRNARGVMRDVLVTVTNETYEQQLLSTTCDVALVWGALDGTVPPAVAEQAAALLGERASLTVLDGVGHQVPLEAPDALRAAIERRL